ncbi:hypothetical protein RJZ90_004833 [Blastomyces dermatitidis]
MAEQKCGVYSHNQQANEADGEVSQLSKALAVSVIPVGKPTASSKPAKTREEPLQVIRLASVPMRTLWMTMASKMRHPDDASLGQGKRLDCTRHSPSTCSYFKNSLAS